MSGKVTVALLAGLGMVGLCGCEVRVAPRHAFVAVETPPPDAVVVETAPPADQVEAPVGVAPGPDYVWVGGVYVWEGGRYVWHRGHWDHPPYRGAHFDRGHWAHGPHGYFFVQGGWR